MKRVGGHKVVSNTTEVGSKMNSTASVTQPQLKLYVNGFTRQVLRDGLPYVNPLELK